MKKSLLSLAVSAAIVISPLPALAETAAAHAMAPKVEATGPLAPGGAAGVQQAQAFGVPLFWWIAGAAAVGAIVWVAVDSNNDDSSSTN